VFSLESQNCVRDSGFHHGTAREAAMSFLAFFSSTEPLGDNPEAGKVVLFSVLRGSDLVVKLGGSIF